MSCWPSTASASRRPASRLTTSWPAPRAGVAETEAETQAKVAGRRRRGASRSCPTRNRCGDSSFARFRSAKMRRRPHRSGDREGHSASRSVSDDQYARSRRRLSEVDFSTPGAERSRERMQEAARVYAEPFDAAGRRRLADAVRGELAQLVDAVDGNRELQVFFRVLLLSGEGRGPEARRGQWCRCGAAQLPRALISAGWPRSSVSAASFDRFSGSRRTGAST